MEIRLLSFHVDLHFPFGLVTGPSTKGVLSAERTGCPAGSSPSIYQISLGGAAMLR
jgi:hypothetical protein